MKINNLLLSICFVILISGVFSFGEGDKDGHPTYYERTSLLAINLARNNPYAYARKFMSSFDNYTYSDYSSVYSYGTSYYIPKKPMQYNNELNRLANGYLQMFLDTPGCDITGLQFCNGTQYSDYISSHYTYTSDPFVMGYFNSYGGYKVSPGYGAIMEMICDRVDGTCSNSNLTSDAAALKQRYLFLYPRFNQLGSASAMIDGRTYIVTYIAEGSYLYDSPIAAASHIWDQDNNNPAFYLIYYDSDTYPFSVTLMVGNNNITMPQYFTASDYLSNTSPYATFKLNYTYGDLSECDSYYFEIKTTYGGYSSTTIRYPSNGYLTLAKESSTCAAWSTSYQGISTSSTLTYSLSVLLLSLILILI